MAGPGPDRMENLDTFLGAYQDSFEFAFDNRIILNWYPRRISARCASSLRVLELGVGHGYTCNLFSRHFESYTVIDASQEVLRAFKSQFPESKAKVVECYFENFDTSERFDVIIMGFVLEHVSDPSVILRRYRDFLKPDGRCFVAVPNAASLHRRIGLAAGFLKDIFTLGRGDLALGHKRLYTVDTLDQQMKDCGYQIVRREGIFLKPLTTAQLKSVQLSEEAIEGMCRVGVEYPDLSAGLLFEAVLEQNRE
jgi:2-polyprenyl-3-methyl-5-hydroxy-6-metoxy-1,4-benzoquinol methylase